MDPLEKELLKFSNDIHLQDDIIIVTFDNDERYEIPDALVFGG